jgi:hypothetical protein
MDQPPTPSAVQLEIPGTSALDLASNPMDWLAAIEGSLASIQHTLGLLLANQNPLSAPTSATPALVLGPDFSALHPAAKTVLRPNPLAIFDSDQTQGLMFLYSILTYFQLVLEAFMADSDVSQEKLIWFTMSFMSNMAARWAKRRLSAICFPFPTWTRFEAKFCL